MLRYGAEGDGPGDGICRATGLEATGFGRGGEEEGPPKVSSSLSSGRVPLETFRAPPGLKARPRSGEDKADGANATTLLSKGRDEGSLPTNVF